MIALFAVGASLVFPVMVSAIGLAGTTVFQSLLMERRAAAMERAVEARRAAERRWRSSCRATPVPTRSSARRTRPPRRTFRAGGAIRFDRHRIIIEKAELLREMALA